MNKWFNNFSGGNNENSGIGNLVHSGLNTLGDVAINKYVPEQFRGGAFQLKDLGMNALRKTNPGGMYGIQKPQASPQGM